MHAQLNTRSLPVPAADCGRQFDQCGSLLSCTSLGGAAREGESVGHRHSALVSEGVTQWRGVNGPAAPPGLSRRPRQ